MQVQFYQPHVLLQEFIQCIMVIHAQVDEDATAIVAPYPPTPQTSLFFYINDPIKVQQHGQADFILQPRSVVVGQQLSPVMLDINKDHKAVRVGFHPGGLYRLLGCPMSEMVDASYNAVDIFGNEMSELVTRLQEANGPDRIRELVEGFLLQKVRTLRKSIPFDNAMLELVRNNGNIQIEDVASLACLSLRQFERVSKERIGLSPKLFARLVRFSKAYRLREDRPHWNWTQITYACNYFDQMHLIRDFKEFAGVAPGVIEKELEGLPVRLQANLHL